MHEIFSLQCQFNMNQIFHIFERDGSEIEYLERASANEYEIIELRHEKLCRIYSSKTEIGLALTL